MTPSWSRCGSAGGLCRGTWTGRREMRVPPAESLIIYVPALVISARSWLGFLFNPDQKPKFKTCSEGIYLDLKRTWSCTTVFFSSDFTLFPSPIFFLLLLDQNLRLLSQLWVQDLTPGPCHGSVPKGHPDDPPRSSGRGNIPCFPQLCVQPFPRDKKEAWNSCSVRRIMMNILFSQLSTRALQGWGQWITWIK